MEDIKINSTSDNSNLFEKDSKEEQNEEIGQKDNKSNIELKISINRNENFVLSCSKSREKLDLEIINYLLLSNNKIKDSINKIELQIENIIKNNSTNPLNIQLKDINKDLFMIMEEINKNNKNIFKLLNDKNNEINNNSILNDLNDINKNKKLSNNKLENINNSKDNN